MLAVVVLDAKEEEHESARQRERERQKRRKRTHAFSHTHTDVVMNDAVAAIGASHRLAGEIAGESFREKKSRVKEQANSPAKVRLQCFRGKSRAEGAVLLNR